MKSKSSWHQIRFRYSYGAGKFSLQTSNGYDLQEMPNMPNKRDANTPAPAPVSDSRHARGM